MKPKTNQPTVIWAAAYDSSTVLAARSDTVQQRVDQRGNRVGHRRIRCEQQAGLVEGQVLQRVLGRGSVRRSLALTEPKPSPPAAI